MTTWWDTKNWELWVCKVRPSSDETLLSLVQQHDGSVKTNQNLLLRQQAGRDTSCSIQLPVEPRGAEPFQQPADCPPSQLVPEAWSSAAPQPAQQPIQVATPVYTWELYRHFNNSTFSFPSSLAAWGRHLHFRNYSDWGGWSLEVQLWRSWGKEIFLE